MSLLPNVLYFLVLVFGILSQDHNQYLRTKGLVNQIYRRNNFAAPADLDTAASHHYGHPGRVQIKVYRGPEHDNHASHGYWVRQPADHHY